MDISVLFRTASSTIDLVSKLSKIIQQAEESDKSPRLTQIIADLRTSAVDLCRTFADELNTINSDFFNSGIDVNLSMNELYDELQWYNLYTRYKLNTYNKKFKSIYERLSGFIDDAVAISLCASEQRTLSKALRSATDRTRDLNALMDPDKPLKLIVEEMHEIVRELLEQMHGGQVAYA